MSLAQRQPEQHYCYADYRQWPEDVRYELIEGAAYAMAPAPAVSHQDAVGEIFSQAKAALEGRAGRVFAAPVDVLLPRAGENDDAVDTVVQPDVFAVCDPARIGPQSVRGAPDWLVEVLSPATASHDQVVKRRLYERAGVREYGLVHLTDRLLFVYRLEAGAYGKPDVQPLAGDTAVGVLEGVRIEWPRITRWLPPE
jgi:Uma2 family endonuclease